MSQKNAFMNSPDAAALLKDQAALKTLLSSPETRRLMSALTKQNGAQLTAAAKQAKAGDTSALSAMVSNLAATQEGSRLLNQLEQSLKK